MRSGIKPHRKEPHFRTLAMARPKIRSICCSLIEMLESFYWLSFHGRGLPLSPKGRMLSKASLKASNIILMWYFSISAKRRLYSSKDSSLF
jgi:hypothetical protein